MKTFPLQPFFFAVTCVHLFQQFKLKYFSTSLYHHHHHHHPHAVPATLFMQKYQTAPTVTGHTHYRQQQ